MARGSPLCRGLIKTSTRFNSQGPTCRPQSAKALTMSRGHDNHLDHRIKQAIQRRSGKQVKSFVVMALDEDGNVMTHTTDDVQQCDGIFASDAEECLRIAHKTSVLQATSDHDPRDYSALDDDISISTCDGDDDLIHMCTTHNDGETYRASRSASVRTFGSTTSWPSDVESPGSSHQTPLVELPSHNLSRAKRPTQLQSLKVCESFKIEEFLARALRTMQQLAVKRIAKAWIKGICPKKQAMFPYNKKKREKREKEGLNDERDVPPGWWPATTVCKFIEPDHIKRDERISLCVHLLRLRPTPAQLKEWNKGCVEPHQTHVAKGWTEFLKELAPPSMFDEMREPDDKREEREKLLAQAYDLAKREEQYEEGEIDGDDQFYWHNEIPRAKTTTLKRKVQRTYEGSADESDVDSLVDTAPTAKKSKGASVATTLTCYPVAILPKEVEAGDRMEDCKPTVTVEPLATFGTVTETLSRCSSAASSQRTWSCDSKTPSLLMSMHEPIQVRQTAPTRKQLPDPISSFVDATPRNAFRRPVNQSMSRGELPMEVMPSTYPGRHDYQFPQQNVGHVPTAFRSPYMEHHITPPQLTTLTQGSAIYTPPVMPSLVYPSPDHYNNDNNTMYYGQPDNPQSQLFALPGTSNMDTQFQYSAPSTPFSQYNTTQEPCYTINPAASYQYHPESSQTSYSLSSPRHNNHFQAPAHIDRGFTGHGSGVGGGAHT